MPARLHGVVIPSEPGISVYGGPSISWYLDPLPYDEATQVDLSLSSKPLAFDLVRKAHSRLHSLRPNAGGWIRLSMTHEVLNIFGPDPATSLAYRWL